MAAIRTLVVTVPPLLRDLIAGVLPLDIVAELHSRAGLAAQLRARSPALVLLGLRAGETDAVAQGLPTQAKILVIAHDASQAWLHQPPGRRDVLADLSVAALVAALR